MRLPQQGDQVVARLTFCPVTCSTASIRASSSRGSNPGAEREGADAVAVEGSARLSSRELRRIERHALAEHVVGGEAERQRAVLVDHRRSAPPAPGGT